MLCTCDLTFNEWKNRSFLKVFSRLLIFIHELLFSTFICFLFVKPIWTHVCDSVASVHCTSRQRDVTCRWHTFVRLFALWLSLTASNVCEHSGSFCVYYLSCQRSPRKESAPFIAARSERERGVKSCFEALSVLCVKLWKTQKSLETNVWSCVSFSSQGPLSHLPADPHS